MMLLLKWFTGNLFKVPSCALGKQFVGDVTHLFNAFALETDLEAIGMKAAMTLSSLMLQKPHAKSKTQDHISCLQHSLRFWEKGDVSNLLKEGRALQRLLISSQPSKGNKADNALVARRFPS